MPKQLLPLTGDVSLLRATHDRLAGMASDLGRPIVVCNERHRFLVEAQFHESGVEPLLLLEPVGRNTAPAATVAALVASQVSDEDALLLVLPSDHVVRDVAAFTDAVLAGIPSAASGNMVTFGVVPDRPETGYGYIEADPGGGARPVQRFVEKPDLATARAYLESGRYFWNSGIFLFRAAAFLGEMARYAPDILGASQKALADACEAGRVVEIDRTIFAACRSDSIDYAIMERTDRAVVVPLDAGWSDVGSWAALHEISSRDAAGNHVQGDVVLLDCRDSYIRAESRLVAVLGVDQCVVVETKDAVLVAPKQRAQDVKQLVELLDARKRPEVGHGREVFRPWGSYDSLEARHGFQVKRLAVLPGAVLSLQLHNRRAEHWVVVAGTARITRNDEVFELQRNEHVFIPLGARHRIENPGEDLLEIVEVQIGDYLGEDDIVRFEDKYGRQGRTD